MNETSKLRAQVIRRGTVQMVFGRTRLAVTALFVAAILAMPGGSPGVGGHDRVRVGLHLHVDPDGGE